MSPLTNAVSNLPTATEFQSIADRLACLHEREIHLADRGDAASIIQKHVRGHQERNRRWIKHPRTWFEDGQQGRKWGHNIGGSVEDAIETMLQEPSITGFTYNEIKRSTYFIKSTFVDRVERGVVYHEGNPNPRKKDGSFVNSEKWKHHVSYLKKPAPLQSVPRKRPSHSSPPQQLSSGVQPVAKMSICGGCHKTFTRSGYGLFPSCGDCRWEGSVCIPLAK
jgi:hypothetical protein